MKKNQLTWGIIFAVVITLITAGMPAQAVAFQTIETQRIAGDSRTLTAVEISKEGWADGSDAVILARGDLFPDALAGAVIAKAYDAPILLTNSKTLSPETAQEIERLKAKNVYLLGGTGAISSEIEAGLSATYKVERISGDNRYETSANIAKYLKANNKLQTNTAIIAYAQNFPDALAISSWAAQNGVPILLSETNYLPDTTKNALADLGISKTIITGGTGVISAAVESQLPEATRYGGGDRYDTAVKIIQGLGQDIDTVYLATGSNFPDALAGSALAAKQGKAILLVNNQMNLYVSDFLQAKIGTIHKMVVLGGNGVVTVSSLDQIVKVASGIVEETPAEAVSKALEAIKVLNEEEANKYFSYEEFVNYNNSAGTGVNEEQYAALLFNKLSYKILSSSVSGETAKARVEITTTDMGAVFQEYMEQTIQLAIENALKPEDQQLSEEELGKQAEQILIGILQKNDNQLITTTVDISLTKNNNSWKITMDKDLADALLGGLIKWIENLGAATL